MMTGLALNRLLAQRLGRLLGVALAVLLSGPFLVEQTALVWAEETTGEVSVQVLRGTLSKTDTVTLTLEEALNIALEKNLPLKSAEANVREAKARYWQRLTEALPDLTLSYNNTHYEGAVQGFGNNIFIVDRKMYQPQLIFRFPVFRGGRTFFQIRSAKQLVQAEKSTTESTRQQILKQTAIAYYELKRRMMEIDVAQKQLSEAESQLDLNQARLDVGVGTRLDLMQSKAQMARAHQQLLEAVRLSETAALQLNDLLDLPAIAAVVPQGSDPQMQTLVSLDQDVPALLKIAKEHRPEFQTVHHQIRALEELRRLVWSAVLPEIDVQFRTGGVGTSFEAIKHFDEAAYGLTFNFKNLVAPAWMLYKQNSAQLQNLQAQLAALENTVERELAESWLKAKTRQSQIVMAKTELEASELGYQDALERLKVGVGRNIDLLDAETSLTRARSNLNATIQEYNQSHVELVTLVGLASVETLTRGLP